MQTAPIDTPSPSAQGSAQGASAGINSPAQPPSSLPLHGAPGSGSPAAAVVGAAAPSPSADSLSSDYSAPVLLEKDEYESVSPASGSTSLFGKYLLFYLSNGRSETRIIILESLRLVENGPN